MTLEEFTRFAGGKGWKCLFNQAYGVYQGYPFAMTFHARYGGVLTVSFNVEGKGGGKMVRQVRRQLPKRSGFLLAMAGEHGSQYTLSVPGKENGLEHDVLSAMDTVAAALRDVGLHVPESCALCRKPLCDATALVGGGYVPVHRECAEQARAGALAKAEQGLQGNYFTGFIGAVLGGLVGAIPAILCLNFLNFYVALLYALIPLGANFGYRLFKGKMNRGAFVCSVLASLLNLFTVEFLSVYIQLGMLRHSLPTLGFAWRTFLSYAGDSAFLGSLFMDVLFLALGLWFAWNQLRRTAVHDARDAGLLSATLLVNGVAPEAPAAAASPYTRVDPAAPSRRGQDPWDQPGE